MILNGAGQSFLVNRFFIPQYFEAAKETFLKKGMFQKT
jgi:hypothetical protein